MRHRLRRWFRKPTPLLEQGGVILLYHRVATPACDPLLLSVSPARFADQLAALSAAARVVSLADLLAAPQPKTVAITFDDGYADNYRQALPVLRAHHAPATFYIATGATDTDTEFWWDDLVELFLGDHPLPAALPLTTPTRKLLIELGGAEAVTARAGWTVLSRRDVHPRQRAFRQLFQILKELPSRERDGLLEELHSQTGLPRFRRPEYRAMTTAELRALAADSHATIGAHTVTHPRLASLPREAQRDELALSRSHLSAVLSREVAGCAYPYGGADDFNEDSLRLAQELGFDHACANVPGAVTPTTSAWRLPRVHVRDWTGAELLEALRNFRCR